jgi:enoyl-CoA hydratase
MNMNRPALDYADFHHILFERRAHGILWMTLNRPEVLNAADKRLHTELVEVWNTIDRDPAVRVAVVTGAGRAFSAGGDLNMVENAYRNFEEIARILEEARELVYNMLHCQKPIIAAINGAAVGAGLVVALLADISIASEKARLADGHVRMGVAAGDHAAILWPLLCGMAKAKYYLMTSEFVDGREAERIGLVSMCVPHDELHDRAMEVAVALATGPQYAIRYTKRVLNQWMLQASPIFDHSLALEMLGFFAADMMAGVDALRKKEKARYPSAQEGEEPANESILDRSDDRTAREAENRF